MNVAAAVRGNPSEADFFDEQGLLKEYQPKVMNVLSGTSSDKPIMIEFWLWPYTSFNRQEIDSTGGYRCRCKCYQQEDL